LRVTVFAPDDAAWGDYLQALRHDVYHTAGYHLFEQRRGSGDPRIVVAQTSKARLVWPYLLRGIDVGDGATGLTDITSAYGYSGPLAGGEGVDEEFLRTAWRQVRAVWQEHGVVSAFTRFHPLLDNRLLAQVFAPADGDGPDGVLDVGETVSIDCTEPDDVAMSGYARPLRKRLENAALLGYKTQEDVDWNDLEEFIRVYSESMDRNAAQEFYRFTADDFSFLHRALPGRVHLLLTRAGDEVVAGGIFTESSGIVQSHLMGTATAHLPTSPGKALLDGGRRWARDRGYDVLHLGGGRGGRHDSLFRFKREFSRRRHVFAVGRWIIDPAAYAELRRRHDPQEQQDAGPGGYFPAYRAPVTA
jgi:hypothetical protein